jgi:hypothetical protein
MKRQTAEDAIPAANALNSSPPRDRPLLSHPFRASGPFFLERFCGRRPRDLDFPKICAIDSALKPLAR